MNHLKSVAIVAVLTVFVLSGCAPAPAPAGAPAPAAAPAPKAPAAPAPKAATPAAKPAEPAKPVELVAAGPNFLYNASFETWDEDGKIAAWNLAEGFEEKWTPIDGKKVAAAPQGGTSAIELPAPSADQTVVMSQTVLDGKVEPKRRLAVSAQVNSQEKESVHLLLTYTVGQQTETIRRVSQGSTTWEKLSVEFWVPEGADTASFRVQFIVQKGVKNPVQIDDARIQAMYPKGSEPKPVAMPAVAAPAAASPAKEAAPAKDDKADVKTNDEKSDTKSDSKKSSAKTKSDVKSDTKSSTQKSDKKSEN